jgi:methionyl-tRNA formyltransferase
MQPWPNPYTFLHSAGKPPQRLLILAVRPVPEAPLEAGPGTPLGTDRQRLVVQAGAGAVEILQIQPEGKRSMPAADFLRGRQLGSADRFGPEPA